MERALPGAEARSAATRRRAPAVPPPVLTLLALVAVALLLAAWFGPVRAGQATANGLVAGSYLGLGALGLTLVFGVLRLVNFAHGDLLTAGAYGTIAFAGLGLPIAAAVVLAALATAALAYLTELMVWAPMRARRAGTLQLFLTAIGVAFVIRFSIQFFSGSQARTLGLDTTTTVTVAGIRLGVLQAGVLLVGLVTMVAVGLLLRYSRTGREMRAYSGNPVLAEVSGIDTRRIIAVTWLAAGFFGGLAGVLYGAALGTFNPNLGFTLLLSLFAAAILGGIGNAYGALVGGIVIGLSQEWATLFFNARWKPAVGFAILVLTLLLMPNGIFGTSRRRS